MAKLKKPRRTMSANGRAVSAKALPDHEGTRPDPADVDGHGQWLRARRARMVREVGGPRDPRYLVMVTG